MKAFSEWTAANDPLFATRKALCFDLDDTLTDHGALGEEIVPGLMRAQKAGWITILVTGRPAGWADALVKLLPFDAIVSENGALLHVWEGKKSGRKARQEPRKLYWQPDGSYGPSLPAGLKDRHADAIRSLLKSHPRARVASDQAYRLYDLAIDFAEEVDPPLGLTEAQAIARDFAALGATAKVSSIHVNGWWGSFSKDSGLAQALRLLGGWNPREHAVYVGDSPNDSPLFKAAGVSVGVANVKEFVGMAGFDPPAYVTMRERASGAAEVLAQAARSPRS